MSPTVHFIYYGLWFAHPVLQLAVAGVMFQRKLYRKFPVFFAYAISQVVIFSILFPAATKGSYRLFFYSYWITAAMSLALGFWVIYEIFLDVFRPYHTLKDLGTVLFKWASLVLLLVAAVVAAASPTSDAGPLVQTVLTVQRCVRVIQCGLVLFLLLFARYLGVSRQQHSFGISLGFGAFASVELFIVALHSAAHTEEVTSYLVNMIAYNCAILIWLGYMLLKKQPKGAPEDILIPQRWDQSFMDLQHPMPAEALIPMFENMVEEAISRGQGNPSAGAPEDVSIEPEQTLQERLSASLTAPGDTPAELASSAKASGSTSSKP